ncbi:hypothetical protein ACJMK2_002236 [Sinanodonta woodiana]|uniref:Mediator of RNA polymerase II transcription subunit 30 n=1 Tax=Sinanodonta woodiana TaxID=1069815 RepID=A0ABD3XUM7_SINWO
MATPGHGYQQSQSSIIASQGQGSVVTSALQGQMMASHGQGPIMTSQGQGTITTSQGQGQIMHSSQLSGNYGSIGGQQGQAYPGQSNPPMVSPSKSSPNSVSLCKLGQETVKELVQKMVEVFKYFQTTQLPNGLNNQIYQERRAKLEESLRALNMMFRKLRVVYDKLVTSPEPEPPEEHLIPFVDEPALEKNTNTDVYRYATEEHKQIVEQIRIRNRLIKEVIDKIRTIIWEINTMIIMRKTPEPNFS